MKHDANLEEIRAFLSSMPTVKATNAHLLSIDGEPVAPGTFGDAELILNIPMLFAAFLQMRRNPDSGDTIVVQQEVTYHGGENASRID